MCPHCNVPYCSQTCYAGDAHAACARKLAQRNLDEARALSARERRFQSSNTNAASTVPIGPHQKEEADEQQARSAAEAHERARMMAVLRRLEQFDLDRVDSAPNEEPKPDDDDDDEAITEKELGTSPPLWSYVGQPRVSWRSLVFIDVT